MSTSIHYFNENKQQIYRLKNNKSIVWFINKNAGKYLAGKLKSVFNGLRLVLLGLAIISFFL